MFELQVRDFNEYRRQLAAMSREATPGGEQKKMQARVSQTPGSRLTLSDGALGTGAQGQKAIAEHLAKQAERAAQLAAEIRALSASQAALPASAPPKAKATSPARKAQRQASAAEPAASSASSPSQGKR